MNRFGNGDQEEERRRKDTKAIRLINTSLIITCTRKIPETIKTHEKRDS